MDKLVHVSWCEDETCSQLERILTQLCLPEPASLGALAVGSIVLAEKVEQVGLLQLRRAIGFTISIDQEWECDSRLLAEGTGIVHITQPYGREIRALGLKFLLVFAQLRDVLAAEDSTIVPQKHDDRRPLRPK